MKFAEAVLLFIVCLTNLDTSTARTKADDVRKFEAGDLRLLRAAVTGKHSMALTAVTEGASAGAMLTPTIGEDMMELGVVGVDFVAGPAVHVAMTGATTQHAEVSHFLINLGADPTLYSTEITTEVAFAPAIMYTLGYHVLPNSSRAALLQKLVIAFPHKFDMSRVRTWALSTNNSLPLHCAVEAQFYDGVYTMATMNRLVPRFVFDVNERDSQGRTALMLAAVTGQTELMRLLIHNNAKVTLYDTYKRTALHHAAINGHVGAIQAILTARKELEVLRKLSQLKDADGRTALELASLTPVKLPIVRALRAAMTPLGVVPHSTPWLAKPKVLEAYKKRNVSEHISEYATRAQQSMRADAISAWNERVDALSRAVQKWTNSRIDCVLLSSQFAAGSTAHLFKNYVSTRRPFLAVPDESNESVQFNVPAVENVFASLNSDSETYKVESVRSLTTSTDGNSPHSTMSGLKDLFFPSPRRGQQEEIDLDVDGGTHGRQVEGGSQSISKYMIPHESLFVASEVVSDYAAGLNTQFASEWCERPRSHRTNREVVTIGSIGGLTNGTVPLYAHFHSKLLSGVKLWCLFAPIVNETAREVRLEDALQNRSSPEFVSVFLAEILTTLDQGDMHTTLQYADDIVHVPSGWMFISVNILPSVSVFWQNCMLDLSVPNCEVHSVRKPVSF